MSKELIEEKKVRIQELEHEIQRLKGQRGICSQCGEEGFYSNWGQEDEPKICSKCWKEDRIAKARSRFTDLIGLQIEDVIIDSGFYPFQGLKLEGGITIWVAANREGCAYLEIEKKEGRI